MSRNADPADGSPRSVADLLARYGEQAPESGRRHRRRAADPDDDPPPVAPPPVRPADAPPGLGRQLRDRRDNPDTEQFPRIDPLLLDPPPPPSGPGLGVRSGEPPAGLGPVDAPVRPAEPSWSTDAPSWSSHAPARPAEPSWSADAPPRPGDTRSWSSTPSWPADDPLGAGPPAPDPGAAPRLERPRAAPPGQEALDGGLPDPWAPAAEPERAGASERTGVFDVRSAFDDEDDDDPWGGPGSAVPVARTGATVAPRPDAGVPVGRRRRADPDEPDPGAGAAADPAAGGRRALDTGEDDDELDAGSPVREWALMASQVLAGVVGGAALWLACEWLWQRIPVVALVVALAVITGLVWVVRRVRRAEDLNTTVVAVLVGLFVTVSPAALLLVGR